MSDCNNNNIVSVERDICTGIGNNTIHQLNKLDETLGKRKRVRIYPITYIQAVYDAKTGTRLDGFLNMVNSIYLPWRGSAKSTRLQVPFHLRRKGLMISYRNIDNEIITEKCILEECIKDDLFKLDSSWVRITDALPVSGNVTIGSNGNWFVDGEDTGFKAQGPKGDNGVPLQPRLSEDGTKIEYSLDGEEWKELFPLSLITPNISFEEPVGLEPGATPTVENVGDGFNVNLQFGLPKAPEVNVGSTTTIGEGNQAKVTNSGTPYAPVLNFQIPKGDTGRGITIKGFYPDLSTLQEKITSPAIGDVYCVGSAEPYTGYVWTNVYNSESQTATPAWQSIGSINKDTTILVNDLGDREDVGVTQKGVTENIDLLSLSTKRITFDIPLIERDNYFNKDDIIKRFYVEYSPNVGYKLSRANNLENPDNWIISNIIRLIPNTRYYLYGVSLQGYRYGLLFNDINDIFNYNGGIVVTGSSFNSENYKYFVFTVSTPKDSDDIDINEVIVTTSNSGVTIYNSPFDNGRIFKEQLPFGNIDSEILNTDNQILQSRFTSRNNLFDYRKALLGYSISRKNVEVEGKTYLVVDGDGKPSRFLKQYSLSNYIPVKQDTYYILTGTSYVGVFYDEFLNVVGVEDVVSDGITYHVASTSRVIYPPKGAKFFVFDVQTPTINTDWNTAKENIGIYELSDYNSSKGYHEDTEEKLDLSIIPDEVCVELNKNLFNKDKIVNGYVNLNNTEGKGMYSLTTLERFYVTEFIPVVAGATYRISGIPLFSYGSLYAAFFTARKPEDNSVILPRDPNNGVFWGYGTSDTVPADFRANVSVAPDDAKYLAVTVQTNFESSLEVDLDQVCIELIKLPATTSTKNILKEELVGAGATVRRRNLFDYTKVKTGYVVINNLGDDGYSVPDVVQPNYSSNTNYIVSDYIPVEPGKTYKLTNYNLFAPKALQGIFLGKNLKPAKYNLKAADDNYLPLSGNIFTAPKDAWYFIFNISTNLSNATITADTIRDIQLEEIDNCYPVEEYSSDTNYSLDKEFDNRIEEVNLCNLDYIAIYGNSFTASYYSILGKSWIEKVSNLVDYNLWNHGVSGEHITDNVRRMVYNNNVYQIYNGTRCDEYSRYGIYDFKPKYVSVSLIQNDQLYNTPTNNIYPFNKEFLLANDIIKARGAYPILGIDHVTHNPAAQSQVHALADNLKCYNALFGNEGEIIVPSNNVSNFWYSSHPGVRTNCFTTKKWLDLIDKLDRPNKSIKIFRLSSYSSNLSISNLNYGNNLERSKNWHEICIGVHSLTNESEYDNSANYSGSKLHYNEYLDILAKRKVPFTNKALVEFIIPKIGCNRAQIKIQIKSEEGGTAKFYMRNNASNVYRGGGTANRTTAMFEVSKSTYDSFSATIGETATATLYDDAELTYQGKFRSYSMKVNELGGYFLCFTTSATIITGNSGSITYNENSYDYFLSDRRWSYYAPSFWKQLNVPAGEFEEVTANDLGDGYYSIDINSIDYFYEDKLSLIIEYSGTNTNTFYLYNPSIKVYNGYDKISNSIPYDYLCDNTELLRNTGFEDSVIWSGGTIKQLPSAYKDYPLLPSTEHHIEIGWDSNEFPEEIETSLDGIIPSSEYDQKFLLRVVARIYPKVYTGTDTDDTTSTVQITEDSYDYGVLCAGVKFRNPVDSANYPKSIQQQILQIGWSVLYYVIHVPAFSTPISLSLWRDEYDINDRTKDYPVQIHSVSMKRLIK